MLWELSLKYQELLKEWMVRLWDESHCRTFDRYMLQCDYWQWWDKQSFRLEGLIVNRKTHKRHRVTSHVEHSSGLQFRIYTVGPEV